MTKTPRNRKKKTTISRDNFVVDQFTAPEELDGELEEFEPALLIDEDKLDEALHQQADLFYRVAKTLTLQISRRDAAKQLLANQEATVDTLIRKRYEGDRVTVAEVEAQKRLHPKVVEATDQLLRMNHSVMQWSNLKEAVIQRGHILRELVSLYVNQYYATATDNRDTRQMRTERAAKVGRHY